MEFLNSSKPIDINQGLNEYKATQGAILLDVRTAEEYENGYIPDSKNIPFQDIAKAANVIDDKNTPLYVLCNSGSRSSQAVNILRTMGYTNVKNIGGISAYTGKVIR